MPCLKADCKCQHTYAVLATRRDPFAACPNPDCLHDPGLHSDNAGAFNQSEQKEPDSSRYAGLPNWVAAGHKGFCEHPPIIYLHTRNEKHEVVAADVSDHHIAPPSVSVKRDGLKWCAFGSVLESLSGVIREDFSPLMTSSSSSSLSSSSPSAPPVTHPHPRASLYEKIAAQWIVALEPLLPELQECGENFRARLVEGHLLPLLFLPLLGKKTATERLILSGDVPTDFTLSALCLMLDPSNRWVIDFKPDMVIRLRVAALCWLPILALFEFKQDSAEEHEARRTVLIETALAWKQTYLLHLIADPSFTGHRLLRWCVTIVAKKLSVYVMFRAREKPYLDVSGWSPSKSQLSLPSICLGKQVLTSIDEKDVNAPLSHVPATHDEHEQNLFRETETLVVEQKDEEALASSLSSLTIEHDVRGDSRSRDTDLASSASSSAAAASASSSGVGVRTRSQTSKSLSPSPVPPGPSTALASSVDVSLMSSDVDVSSSSSPPSLPQLSLPSTSTSTPSTSASTPNFPLSYALLKESDIGTVAGLADAMNFLFNLSDYSLEENFWLPKLSSTQLNTARLIGTNESAPMSKKSTQSESKTSSHSTFNENSASHASGDSNKTPQSRSQGGPDPSNDSKGKPSASQPRHKKPGPSQKKQQQQQELMVLPTLKQLQAMLPHLQPISPSVALPMDARRVRSPSVYFGSSLDRQHPNMHTQHRVVIKVTRRQKLFQNEIACLHRLARVAGPFPRIIETHPSTTPSSLDTAAVERGDEAEGLYVVVMSYCGSAFDASSSSWAALQQVGVQLIRAVLLMHQQQVFHRDIKPANVVVTAAEEAPALLRVTLIDFDLAVCGTLRARGHVGTRGFTAPEVKRFNERCRDDNNNEDNAAVAAAAAAAADDDDDDDDNCYDERADVYSVGRCLESWGAKISRQRCHHSLDVDDNCELEDEDDHERHLADLVLRLTQADPQLRLGLNEALLHPFFRGVR